MIKLNELSSNKKENRDSEAHDEMDPEKVISLLSSVPKIGEFIAFERALEESRANIFLPTNEKEMARVYLPTEYADECDVVKDLAAEYDKEYPEVKSKKEVESDIAYDSSESNPDTKMGDEKDSMVIEVSSKYVNAEAIEIKVDTRIECESCKKKAVCNNVVVEPDEAHHSEVILKYSECEYNVTPNYATKHHMIRLHEPNETRHSEGCFICNECEHNVTSNHAFKSHIRSLHESYSFTCVDCGIMSEVKSPKVDNVIVEMENFILEDKNLSDIMK